MCPSEHPIKIHGIKIPEGTAVPLDNEVKMNQITKKIRAFENNISR